MSDHILELEQLANEHGATIYEICHRNAGWGVCYHEDARVPNPLTRESWRQQLVVYDYYPTPTEMFTAELERLKKLRPEEVNKR